MSYVEINTLIDLFDTKSSQHWVTYHSNTCFGLVIPQTGIFQQTEWRMWCRNDSYNSSTLVYKSAKVAEWKAVILPYKIYSNFPLGKTMQLKHIGFEHIWGPFCNCNIQILKLEQQLMVMISLWLCLLQKKKNYLRLTLGIHCYFSKILKDQWNYQK